MRQVLEIVRTIVVKLIDKPLLNAFAFGFLLLNIVNKPFVRVFHAMHNYHCISFSAEKEEKINLSIISIAIVQRILFCWRTMSFHVHESINAIGFELLSGFAEPTHEYRSDCGSKQSE